ncbi:MAG TPA: glycosyltransferase [Opitutus sp.]|nr:glycosyltransferase [Opitutus sp.]
MEPSIASRLEEVLALPESARRWQRLYELLLPNAAAAGREEALARLETYVAPNSDAQFLWATCLHPLNRRPEYLRAAAAAARRIVPFRADRIHALLLYLWTQALFFAGDREKFAAGFLAVDAADLLRLLSREIEEELPVRRPRRTFSEVRRVAVVAPDMRNIRHAPTAMAVRNAGVLREAGLDVQVFGLQEHDFAAMPQLLGSGILLRLPKLDIESWRTLMPVPVKLNVTDAAVPLLIRWKFNLLSVEAFDPDVVLFVGFVSPLPYLLFDQRPVAAISVHTVPPIVPTDVWLAPTPELAADENSPWAEALPPAVIHHHPFRVVLKPMGQSLSRGELQLPRDRVVLLSVGDRLETEINGPWAAAMTEFLRKHPGVLWLIVGGRGTMAAALKDGPVDQIRTVRHHPEVRAICRCCDIFVNPKRIGGGFSVCTAMAEGLPVVAYAGSDGGDKLGELASANDAGYFETLEALVRQPELRRSRGAALQRKFAEELDMDRGAASLVAGCRKAVAVFNERTGATR